MRDRRWIPLFCASVGILLYIPTLDHDFVFDDRAAIEANPLVHDLGAAPRALVTPYWNVPWLPGGLYRPLTTLTFAVDWAIAGGRRPGWFHLVNVLLHGLATYLVARLALHILPGRVPSVIAGMLFAVHPVHVEAVAGIVGRAELLAACGAVAAVLCHRRALMGSARGGSAWTIAAWAAALLAMMAKESGATTLMLCAVADLALPSVSAPGRRRRAILYVGHAATVSVYLMSRYAALGTLGMGAMIPFVDNPAASSGPLTGRITALGAIVRYAGLLLWPASLSADYSYDQIPVLHSILDPGAAGGLLIVLGVIGGGIVLLRKAPLPAFALLWMATSASLTTNLLLYIGTLMAERLMYLPSVGLCVLLGWGTTVLPRGRPAALVLAASVAVCVAGTWRSWARLPEWRDDFALYSSAARVSPRSARIRFNLGNAFLRNREFHRAEESYRRALSIYPDFNDARMNLGMAILQQGRAAEALEFFERFAARNPDLAEARVNAGLAHRALGDDAEAERALRAALEIDPRSARAWNNLGSIALSRGEIADAIASMERAVRYDPQLAVLRVNLADALTAAGRHDEAAIHFEAAFRLDPQLPEALRGWGELALSRGDRDSAERAFREAAGGRPPSARAANFLGYLLSLEGRLPEAVEAYERALRIDPELHDAHKNLGLLYAEGLGDPRRAILHFERSLEIAPDQPDAEDLRRRMEELRSITGEGRL